MNRVLTAALLVVAVACNATDSVENCASDGDCALGQRCHPTERFCEFDPTVALIGASLPLTGELGSLGRDLATGIEVASMVINESGGVAGREVRIAVLDDETTVARAEENVQALIEARAVGIVGPLTSPQAIATESLAFDASVVQISPTAGAPELSTAQPARDRYFFRTVAAVRNGSGAAVALFARDGPDGGSPCDEMAILHTTDAIGVAYRDAVEELFEKQGGCVTVTEDFPPEEVVNYEAQVAAVMDAAPGCAIIVAFPEAGVEIIAEFNRRVAADTTRDWSGFFWVGTSSLHLPEFVEASQFDPTDPAQGVYGGDEDTTPLTREYGELRDRYNTIYGRAPDEDLPSFLSNTYDAAMLVALAVQHAGGVDDPVRVRDGVWGVTSDDGGRVIGPVDFADGIAALARGEQIRYKGASSRLAFDDLGTLLSYPSLVWRVEGEEFSTVRRYSDDEISVLLDAPPMPSPTCR